MTKIRVIFFNENGQVLKSNKDIRIIAKNISYLSGKEVQVTPEVIIEVHYEEIQSSPTYSSGFALRFPRIIRVRDDKGLDEIATIYDIERIFAGQKGKE